MLCLWQEFADLKKHMHLPVLLCFCCMLSFSWVTCVSAILSLHKSHSARRRTWMSRISLASLRSVKLCHATAFTFPSSSLVRDILLDCNHRIVTCYLTYILSDASCLCFFCSDWMQNTACWRFTEDQVYFFCCVMPQISINQTQDDLFINLQPLLYERSAVSEWWRWGFSQIVRHMWGFLATPDGLWLSIPC